MSSLGLPLAASCRCSMTSSVAIALITAATFGALAVPAAAQAPHSVSDSVTFADSTAARIQNGPARDSGIATGYRPESFGSFAWRTFGPIPLLKTTALAGVAQWRRQPVGGTQIGRGFRDRLDARLGGELLGRSIRFAVDRAANQQLERFHPCVCEGFEPRLSHALLAPFRVMTPGGERYSVINAAGAIVGALAVTSVHQGGVSWSRGLSSGAGSIASSALTSVAKEFWPWHWRPPGL